MYISTYLANALLDQALGVSAYTPPSTVYAGLFLEIPTDGTSGTEVATGDYVRIVCTFSPATDNVITNSLPLRFPNIGLTGSNWGEIVGLGLFDAITGGNLLFYGPLQALSAMPINSYSLFSAGALSISIGQDNPPPADIDGGPADAAETGIISGGIASTVYTTLYDGGTASNGQGLISDIDGGNSMSMEEAVANGGGASANFTGVFDGGNA